MKRILSCIVMTAAALIAASCAIKVDTETILGKWKIDSATLTVLGVSAYSDMAMLEVKCEFFEDGTFVMDETILGTSILPLGGTYSYNDGILTYGSRATGFRNAVITFQSLKEITWSETISSSSSLVLHLERTR